MIDDNFLLQVALGKVPGYSLIHKFGNNESVGTSIVPICNGGNYQTPTGTITLAAISSDTNDTAAGTGAQQITLVYLDTNFDEQTATIEMNGTTETTGTVTGVKRLYRVYVSRSGTYATQAAASQNGTITVRVAGAGATWATIPTLATSFGPGQSLIGAYTVPAGYTAFILSQIFSIESNKAVSLYFFKRDNANDTSSPYSGVMRIQNIFNGASGVFEIEHKSSESYAEYTDIGFMGATSTGTANVAVEFEMLLVDNNYL